MNAVTVARPPWLPVIAVASIVAAAVGGGAITADTIQTGWYSDLRQPAFNPPRAVFSPVWTVLYVLMAAAFWRVWLKALPDEKDYIGIFFVQISLNFLWSAAFFGMRSPWLGVAVILLLLSSIVAMMKIYARYSRGAVWMTVPYLLWVSFATLLNVAVALLN